MLSDKEIELLTEKFSKRMQKVTEVTYTTIAKRIKKIGKMSKTDLLAINRLVLFTEDMTKIVQELHKQTDKNISEIEEMYKAISENDYKDNKINFEVNNIEYIPYEQNNRLKSIVEAVARATEKEMINIAQTTAIVFNDYIDNKVVY